MNIIRAVLICSIVSISLTVYGNYIIAWDLHDTLIKPVPHKMFSKALSTAPLSLLKLCAALVAGSFNYLYKGKLNHALDMLCKVYAIIKKEQGATAEAYKNILEEYDPCLWDIALAIATAMGPCNGIEEIVKALDRQGYYQIIASNIGSKEFLYLMRTMPSFFKYFQAYVTIDYEHPVKKPSPEYFRAIREKFDAGDTIIFIDDKAENVKAAQEMGMIGIVFVSSDDLKNTLKSLNILLH